ncbi:hypothetical protein ACIO6T_37885 [Streptomyces sp. NPDC087532]|uniref:hypothetical protein n=1 Tax=Streptomyces sp. NPDC087532 TaxID=3365795 RepID=UPI003817DE1B
MPAHVVFYGPFAAGIASRRGASRLGAPQAVDPSITLHEVRCMAGAARAAIVDYGFHTGILSDLVAEPRERQGA